MQSKIAPSMMCADLLRLGEQLRDLEAGGVEYLHIDVMDGVFVQNYTLGTDYIRNLRALSKIPLDIHLMIVEPERKLDWFDFRPGDYVSIHAESTAHAQRALQKIRDRGAKPMLALNPATPLAVVEEVADDLDAVLLMTVNPGFAGQKLVPQTLGKLARLRAWLDEHGYSGVEIEVDGNVSFENARKMRAAGANIFVAGSSSLFMAEKTLPEATEELRQAIL